MPYFSKHPGFTLAELLIGIAIIGFLSAITFTGFSHEGRKSAVRRAAERFQSDVQAAQARAQSGYIFTPSKLCQGSNNDGMTCTADTDCDDILTPPNITCFSQFGYYCSKCINRSPDAYGVLASYTQLTVYQCGDVNSDGAAAIHPNRFCEGSTENMGELGSWKLPTDMIIRFIYNGATLCNPSSTNCNANIFFSVPGGQTTIQQTGGAIPPPVSSQVEVIFKDTKLNLCYGVVVTAASGTVGRKQFTTCPAGV
jgi:prepilin-type N-terminal cleavage/methylation domain-containing protein